MFVSLFVIAVTSGNVTPGAGSFLGFRLTATPVVLLVAGAIFLGITPGFVIGRLGHMRDLARTMIALYERLETGLDWKAQRRSADPFEVSAIVTELWLAVGAADDKRRWFWRFADWADGQEKWPSWKGVADFVGGPLAAVLVLLVLPLVAQGFAVEYWVSNEDSDWETLWWVLGGLLMGGTFASVVVAWRRWFGRWAA